MELDTVTCMDVTAYLRTLPDQSVNCIATSPPYFGLRDYGVDGQIGLEQTPAAYVQALVAVFREARRVLRDDGTFWLNLGDSYVANGERQTGRNDEGAKDLERRAKMYGTGKPKAETGLNTRTTLAAVKDDQLKSKNLLGIPWRVAFGLQDDGWILRSECIWDKPNPMPESVTDRPTKAHETVFLFAKQPTYWYDAEAIAEPCVRGDAGSTYTDGKTAAAKAVGPLRPVGVGPRTDKQPETSSRNKRSVWRIATQPTPEAHFATWPQKLVEPMILAGCPVGGIVLDPFMGSGTTGLVARRWGRHYLGCDLNPEYVAMAQRRLAKPHMVDMFAAVTP